MWKGKLRHIQAFILKNSKIIFPVTVIGAVAITVAIALGAGRRGGTTEAPFTAVETAETAGETGVAQIPQAALEKNEDGPLYTLIATYYNALASGDVDSIRAISNYVSDTEAIRIAQLEKYIESYPLIEIYTKPGPEADSYIAYVYSKVVFAGFAEEIPGLQAFYVCTNDEGRLYLNEGEVSEDVLNYITEVNLQDDVVELNNRVNVECNEIYLKNSALFDFINELEKEVSKATGEALAAQVTESTEGAPAEGEAAAGSEATAEQPVQEQPASEQFALTTTTVNVRVSDSEQAEKAGKLSGSTRVQVLEQKENGWSRILYEGGEGYVKTEFLQMETAAPADSTSASSDGSASAAVGSGVATTNVNIRSQASETSEKIGVLVGGDTAEILSVENGWSKIRYNGLEGYVKSEFIR